MRVGSARGGRGRGAGTGQRKEGLELASACSGGWCPGRGGAGAGGLIQESGVVREGHPPPAKQNILIISIFFF